MKKLIEVSRRQHRAKRKTKGAAVAEMAIALPIPLLFLLGTIDTGQYANVYQAVSNASLEGARVASKRSMSDSAAVKTAVVTYLDNAIANATSAELNSLVSVQISDPATGTVFSSDLSTVTPGTAMQITVSLPYSSIRYIAGLNNLNNQTVQMATVIRRQ